MQDSQDVMQDSESATQDFYGFSEESNHESINHEYPPENEGVDEAYLAHLAATAGEEGIRCSRPKGVCTTPLVGNIPDLVPGRITPTMGTPL